jgi:hypothetical protein
MTLLAVSVRAVRVQLTTLIAGLDVDLGEVASAGHLCEDT